MFHYKTLLRWCLLLALLGLITPAMAQSGRPPEGVTLDETRSVTLLSQPPGPCISVVRDEVTILLSRAMLEEMAHPARFQRENELNQPRAQTWLKAAQKGKRDAYGCARVKTMTDYDADYLLANLLEHGQAQVLQPEDSRPIPTIKVRYIGRRFGDLAGQGFIEFTLPNGDMFFRVEWWVA
jgi:hypothetical protein